VIQSFYQWLQLYKTDDSALGNLARTAGLDRRRPRTNTLAAWEAHVKAMGGSDAVLELLGEAWQLYDEGASPTPSE
jgi:YozE SAM-like fold